MRKKVTAEIAIAAIGTNQATSATSWGIGKLILQTESQRIEGFSRFLKIRKKAMDTIDTLSVDAERNDKQA
jgi:hypothetical protein